MPGNLPRTSASAVATLRGELRESLPRTSLSAEMVAWVPRSVAMIEPVNAYRAVESTMRSVDSKSASS